jgi:protein TonB
MFEDSLLESGGRLKTKRGRTTTFAIILEVALIGLMVLMPLIFTEALPKQQLMTFLVAPPPPPLRRLRPQRQCMSSSRFRPTL